MNLRLVNIAYFLGQHTGYTVQCVVAAINYGKPVVGDYPSRDGNKLIRGVQVLANSQIFANLYMKFANLI